MDHENHPRLLAKGNHSPLLEEQRKQGGMLKPSWHNPSLHPRKAVCNAVDNKKKHCAGVFIDLKKAFDTVNHDLLVKKPFFYGIRGTANAWLNNNLTNINQYVIADDHSSGMRLITCGVPQ